MEIKSSHADKEYFQQIPSISPTIREIEEDIEWIDECVGAKGRLKTEFNALKKHNQCFFIENGKFFSQAYAFQISISSGRKLEFIVIECCT